jgi:hypothetical protein
MATNSAEPTPNWTVVGVNAAVDVSTGTTPVKGHTVQFRTAAGNRGQVFIPDTVPSLDAAKDIIAAQVSYVDGLAALKG